MTIEYSKFLLVDTDTAKRAREFFGAAPDAPVFRRTDKPGRHSKTRIFAVFGKMFAWSDECNPADDLGVGTWERCL